MSRHVLTDGSGRWFDGEKAEKFEEDTYSDGRNNISKATGSQFHHVALYRTAGGIWIKNAWGDFHGCHEQYSEISKEQAAIWLAENGYEPHKDVEAEFASLELE